MPKWALVQVVIESGSVSLSNVERKDARRLNLQLAKPVGVLQKRNVIN